MMESAFSGRRIQRGVTPRASLTPILAAPLSARTGGSTGGRAMETTSGTVPRSGLTDGFFMRKMLGARRARTNRTKAQFFSACAASRSGRQHDPECRTCTTRCQRYLAPVRIDDRAADGEPEAGTARLRAEEWIEDARR